MQKYSFFLNNPFLREVLDFFSDYTLANLNYNIQVPQAPQVRCLASDFNFTWIGYSQFSLGQDNDIELPEITPLHIH